MTRKKIRGDGFRCGKSEKLRELFFTLENQIKQKLVECCQMLNSEIDTDKKEHFLSKFATDIFNLVNCQQEEFYGSDEVEIDDLDIYENY